MVADAALASVLPAGLRRDRILATATLALLVSCVFDVGRVLYYRMLINYAVTHSARVLARDEGRATASADRKDPSELVQRLSGVKDITASVVRVDRAPSTRDGTRTTGRAIPAVIVMARYTVPLVSAPLWPVFGDGRVSIEAVGVDPGRLGARNL